MTVGFLVTSHVKYNKPLEKLLTSLSRQTDHIITVIAGCAHSRDYYAFGMRFIHVCDNSFDYTPMLWLLDHDIPYSHVFCLQDTCICGDTFVNKVLRADLTKDATGVHQAQCNLALYKVEYLRKRAKFIRSMENCTKKQSIDYEGHLFKTCVNKADYPDTVQELGLCTPYNDNVQRMKEYYPGIDLYKYKANYGQTNEQTYILQP